MQKTVCQGFLEKRVGLERSCERDLGVFGIFLYLWITDLEMHSIGLRS
jgi:hypothetical protein